MKPQDVIAALGALAQDSRLAVYRLLVRRGPEGYTPGELAVRLRIPAPTLSFHLKGLQRAGLVSVRRQARFLYYSANFTRMNSLLEYLTANCCSLADVGSDTECAPAVPRAAKRRA